MEHLLRRVLYFFLSKYFIMTSHLVMGVMSCSIKRYNWRDISTVQVIDVDERAFLLLLLEVKIDK